MVQLLHKLVNIDTIAEMCDNLKMAQNKHIWDKLPKPFVALAPMYDVTDSAFRQIITTLSTSSYLDVFFTEFVSADGLCHQKAKSKLLRELYFTKKEKPIIAQIFGANPEMIYKAVKMISKLGSVRTDGNRGGFDGLDINMGCPDKTIIKQGAGSALIKNPKLAREIIKAAKRGVYFANGEAGKLPISVKTRLGFNKIEFKEWLSELLAEEPAAITVHLRTKKELSEVPAHWELVPEIKKLFVGQKTKLIINGDIPDLNTAKKLAKKYQVDGVMIGRGIFNELNDLKILIKHAKLFEKLYRSGPTNEKLFHGHTKNFDVMKKFFKAYVKDFPGASDLRAKLMTTKSAKEVEKIINDFRQKKMLG